MGGDRQSGSPFRLSHPDVTDEEVLDSMLAPITQLTPTQVKNLVKAMALSNTEYWVIEDTDLDEEFPPTHPGDF